MTATAELISHDLLEGSDDEARMLEWDFMLSDNKIWEFIESSPNRQIWRLPDETFLVRFAKKGKSLGFSRVATLEEARNERYEPPTVTYPQE